MVNSICYFKPTHLHTQFKDSELAKQMLSAEMGIVWHTEYVGGPNLADTKAKFGFDSLEIRRR